MHKKEPQKPPEHNSEHVKPQHFLEVCAQTTPYTIYIMPPILSAALDAAIAATESNLLVDSTCRYICYK